MAVRTAEEIMASVKERIGEDTSDEALAFIEDIQDTLSDMNTRVSESGDWKQKYEENDRSWREKYQKRFFEGTPSDNDTHDTDPKDDEPEAPKRFEDLFNFE